MLVHEMQPLTAYFVTKGSSDRTFRYGDIIWISPNGNLHNKETKIVLKSSEWNRPKTNDFECKVTKAFIVDINNETEAIKPVQKSLFNKIHWWPDDVLNAHYTEIEKRLISGGDCSPLIEKFSGYNEETAQAAIDIIIHEQHRRHSPPRNFMTKEKMLQNKNRKNFFFCYEYRLERGIETQKKQPIEITEIFSSGFTYKGHKIFQTPFSRFYNWHQAGTDECQYVYTIFLTVEDDINDYLPAVKQMIVNDIQKRIDNLNKMLQAVQSKITEK